MDISQYIYFNELALPISPTDVDTLVEQYAQTVAAVCDLGFRKVCYESFDSIVLSKDIYLKNYCIENRKNDKVALILTAQKIPYIDPETEQEKKFVEAQSFKVRVNDVELDSYGFAAAYLHNSVTISFATNGFEHFDSFKVTKYMSAKNWLSKDVCCICSPDDINRIEFAEWVYANVNIWYTPSTIPIEKKLKHISQHHGSHELNEFSQRLLREPFINEVINSIDRDSRDKKLISRKVYPNIELRLVGDGYGLVVSTTAHNLCEYECICIYLQEKYV